MLTKPFSVRWGSLPAQSCALAVALCFGACASDPGGGFPTVGEDASIDRNAPVESGPVITPDVGPPPCTKNEDCSGSLLGKYCNIPAGQCVECSPVDDQCPLGQYCSPDKLLCTFGCRTNRDCEAMAADAGAEASADGGPTAALQCDLSSRYCVGCLTDVDCPLGTLCNSISKACVPGCNPNHGCGPGYECCGDACINVSTSAQHCGACNAACDVASSIGAACANGSCTYQGCKQGYADCDTTAPNREGCETGVDTIQNCGVCGRVCDTEKSEGATCAGGTCRYSGCKSGFADCNKRAPNTDGCETAIDTPTSCGACGMACDSTTASGARCEAYLVSSGSDAGADSGDAGEDAADAGDASGDGGGVSVAYRCAYDSCKSGFADCRKSGSNIDGCETSLATPDNCGACGTTCGAENVRSATCGSARCSYECLDGWANCTVSGANTQGCETPINTVTNCGGCNNACDRVHSVGAMCLGASCAYSSCVAGFADCDTAAPNTNGCETPLNTTSNCGACGKTCTGAEGCCGGTCTALNTTTNCGTCGKSCGAYEGCCGGSCASLWLEGNCGACGVTCGAGKSCLERSCKSTLSTGSSTSGTCAQPKVITANGTFTGSTASSATAFNVSCAGTQSNSPGQVYAFTALKSGTVTINACASSFDTYVYAGTGCSTGLIYDMACNDDSSSCGTTTRSRISFTAVVGQTYYVVIAGSGTGTTGSYSFTVSGL